MYNLPLPLLSKIYDLLYNETQVNLTTCCKKFEEFFDLKISLTREIRNSIKKNANIIFTFNSVFS
jgi:hypothetical protein